MVYYLKINTYFLILKFNNQCGKYNKYNPHKWKFLWVFGKFWEHQKFEPQKFYQVISFM